MYHRRIMDRIIKMMAEKGGVVMLGFFSRYVSKECFEKKLNTLDPKKMPRARIGDLIDHIDYIKKLVGIDHVGIGSDYDGTGRLAPKGLETAEGFPLIIYHMLKRGYKKKEIKKVMGGNFLRLLKKVESAAKR